MKSFLFISAAAIFSLILLAGCAQHSASSSPTTLPASAMPVDARANLSLGEIQPIVLLPNPATQPSTPVSDRALQLYAQALGDLMDHHPYPAIDALHEAMKLEPDSADLYYAMGRAQLDRLQVPSDQSFDAFENSASIRPDSLQIQLLLGRQYMAIGNNDKALDHLRQALLTTEYRQNAAGSAAVELFLARDLEQMGYSRAALDEFGRVDHRLQHPTRDLWADPDTAFVANTPPIVTLEIATLHEKLGEYEAALKAYKSVADQDPANYPLQAKMVQMLVKLGREDQAIGQAADMVVAFRANPESLALLHATCQSIAPQRELEVLQNLHRKNSDDKGILFALSDALAEQGQRDSARQLLTEAATAHPADEEILRKLFDFYVSAEDVDAAARLLVTQLAASPDSVDDINSLLVEIIRPTAKTPLRLSRLQKMQFPAPAMAGKLYLVAESAEVWHRDALARSSVEQAVKQSPPFAPAYRRYVSRTWARPDLSVNQKKEACDFLAQAAETGGNPSLAAEVRGLNLMNEGNINGASEALRQALQLGGTSPDLQLTYAAVLAGQKQLLQCEQVLWKLVADQPRNDEAWGSLHSFFENTNRPQQSTQVLAEWLRADPGSPNARILEAQWTGRHGQEQSAIDQLTKLLQDHSDDLALIQKIESVFIEFHRPQEFVTHLLQLHHDQPANLTLLAKLVDIAQVSGQSAQAIPLIDESRKTIGNDPDLLYQIASFYHEVGQIQTSNDILDQILKIDPGNVPASNDLGFSWADAGINLDRAEQLIRVAVDAEPDNQAFLDSLGWVLYKQSKFADAVVYFDRAIGPAALPDPQILDHFGDDLYRMGRIDEAQNQWRRALSGLMQDHEPDNENLMMRQMIQNKLSGSATSRPVDVAPLAPTTQASQ